MVPALAPSRHLPDDDDVIGLTVAKTYPSGWAIVRTDPPLMDGFDEYGIGTFLAWCLSHYDDIQEWLVSDP